MTGDYVKLTRTKKRQYAYDRAYMKMAIAMSELSYSNRMKVGAIIVSKDDQVISQGFNGTPAGWDNACEKLNEKTGELETVAECLHAESNAIAKCAKFHSSTEGATIYVTLSPCSECAKLIIQSGIKRVIFLKPYRNLDGVRFLQKCGIPVFQINMQEDDGWDYIADVDKLQPQTY